MAEPSRAEIAKLFWHLEIAFDPGFVYMSGNFVSPNSGSHHRKSDFTHRDLDDVIDLRKKLGMLKEEAELAYEILRLKFAKGFELPEISAKLEISDETVNQIFKDLISYFLLDSQIPKVNSRYVRPERIALNLGDTVLVLDTEFVGKNCRLIQIIGQYGDRAAVEYFDNGKLVWREVSMDWLDW